MESRPKPIQDSTSDSVPVQPGPSTKRCNGCRAVLPMSHYGLTKSTRDGYRVICKTCRNQDRRVYWSNRFGTKRSQADEGITRNVKRQNETILTQALQSLSTFSCLAFRLDDLKDFKVVFGPSDITGLSSITVFSLDGEMLRSLSYSGMTSSVPEELLAFLKQLNLRLELSEVDSIASKTTIYFF